MKRVCQYCILLILLLSAAAWASMPMKAETVQGKPVSYLFTQTAKSAHIMPIDKKPHLYLLTLFDVGSHTTWFTDRPARKAGVLKTSKFVSHWNNKVNDFADINPNASFVYTLSGKSDQEVMVLRLAYPTYNAKKRTLSYQAEDISNKKVISMRLNTVAVFIDAFCFGGINC